ARERLRASGACGHWSSCPHRSRAAPLFSGLDRLAVDNRRARLPVTAYRLAEISAQLVVYSLPRAVKTPAPKVMIHRLPVREVVRQKPPRTSGAHQIQNRVQDGDSVMLGGSSSCLGLRQQILNLAALFLAQVARVALSLHTLPIAHLSVTSTFQTPSKTKRWLLIVGAIVAIAVGSLFFLVALEDHRAAQAYIQQLTRRPRGSWPKDSVAQAVIVRHNHGVGQRQVDREAIAAVGAELSALLVNSSVGKYDGSECARNRCALYLYGPDA